MAIESGEHYPPLPFYSFIPSPALKPCWWMKRSLSVKCFPTNHRIECYGFVIHEKEKPEKIAAPVKAGNLKYRFHFMTTERTGKITRDPMEVL